MNNLFNKLKRHLGITRAEFEEVCEIADLHLNYSLNKREVHILQNIFVNREYSDCFPFYEKSVIVDIGAHYGYFTLFACKNSDKESRIIAVEPARDNFTILCENVATCKLTNVETLNMALSEVQGIQELYRGKSTNYSLFSRSHNALSSYQSDKVETITLPGLLEKFHLEYIDFMKIDCEGAEYSIILNSDADVLNRIHTISMEFHDLKRPELTGNRLAGHLEASGFKVMKYTYSSTGMNLNYGKLVVTKGFTKAK